MTARQYSSVAIATTLTAPLNNSSTSLSVGATTGWPASYPFSLILDEDQATEEIVTVSNVASLTITVTRGVDGSSGQAHDAGATVRHGVSARDYQEPQDHIAATAAHGATGAVVGTTNSQVLTNKTLTTPTITVPVIASFASATHDHSNAAGGGDLANSSITSATVHTTLTMADAANVVINTTTGTKIGTGTTQKLAFYDSTPVVQPTGDVGTALAALGLVASPTFAPGFIGGNLTLVASRTGNAETISIKTLTGGDPSASDPVSIPFRNSTATTGDYALVTLTAATSLTITSTATLGLTSATPGRIWVVGFNDGGTFRLGVVNALSGTSVMPLGINRLASSTTMSSGADSAQVFYTGTGATTKAYIVLGYLDYTLATAGTWDTAPTTANLWRQGDKLPGDTVQTGFTAAQTNASTATVGYSTTSQGIELCTVAVSPTAAANLLHVHHDGSYANSGVGQNTQGGGGAGLFQDSGASALATVVYSGQNNNSTSFVGNGCLSVSYRALASSTSSTTFKVRFGPAAASTQTTNGATSLSVTEIMA